MTRNRLGVNPSGDKLRWSLAVAAAVVVVAAVLALVARRHADRATRTASRDAGASTTEGVHYENTGLTPFASEARTAEPLSAPPAREDVPMEPGVMPLDDGTLQRFMELNSVVERRMNGEFPQVSPPLRSAMAFRETVKELGFDPDTMLLYWMSPRFPRDVAAGNPNAVAMKTRLVQNQLAIALGDGLDEDSVRQILDLHAPDVRDAAARRRALR